VQRRSEKKEKVENVANIYWRAMKQLNTEFVDTFVQRFCLFKINLDAEKNTEYGVTSADRVVYDIEMDN